MLAIRRATEFVELLLDYGGSALSLHQLEQVLAWVTKEHYRDLQSKCIDLALGHAPPPLKISSADDLFQLAVDVDDKPLIRFLCECDRIPEQKDKYNWTLDQVDASFQLPESQPIFDEKQLRPTRWDLEHKASDLVIGEDQMTVYRDYASEEEIMAVRANNPVRLGEKFYFEIEIEICVTDW
jgi:hypothetical protein